MRVHDVMPICGQAVAVVTVLQHISWLNVDPQKHADIKPKVAILVVGRRINALVRRSCMRTFLAMAGHLHSNGPLRNASAGV